MFANLFFKLTNHHDIRDILSEHLTPTLELAGPREQLLATLGEQLRFGWISIKVFIPGREETLKVTYQVFIFEEDLLSQKD